MSKLKTTAIVMARIVVFLLCTYFIIWATCLLLNWGGAKYAISYYAVFENGNTVKVDSIIAVPIFSVEQVNKMWPEYYAETTIDIDGKEIILRSRPFLFCDNPGMEGRYEERNIYCFD